MLTETQSNTDFFIAHLGAIRREVFRKIAFVVDGSAANSTPQQPVANAIFPATGRLANFSQQRRHMNSLAEPSGQRLAAQWLNHFHAKTVASQG